MPPSALTRPLQSTRQRCLQKRVHEWDNVRQRLVVSPDVEAEQAREAASAGGRADAAAEADESGRGAADEDHDVRDVGDGDDSDGGSSYGSAVFEDVL